MEITSNMNEEKLQRKYVILAAKHNGKQKWQGIFIDIRNGEITVKDYEPYGYCMDYEHYTINKHNAVTSANSNVQEKFPYFVISQYKTNKDLEISVEKPELADNIIEDANSREIKITLLNSEINQNLLEEKFNGKTYKYEKNKHLVRKIYTRVWRVIGTLDYAGFNKYIYEYIRIRRISPTELGIYRGFELNKRLHNDAWTITEFQELDNYTNEAYNRMSDIKRRQSAIGMEDNSTYFAVRLNDWSRCIADVDGGCLEDGEKDILIFYSLNRDSDVPIDVEPVWRMCSALGGCTVDVYKNLQDNHWRIRVAREQNEMDDAVGFAHEAINHLFNTGALGIRTFSLIKDRKNGNI